jgi:hypothetical protein
VEFGLAKYPAIPLMRSMAAAVGMSKMPMITLMAVLTGTNRRGAKAATARVTKNPRMQSCLM